MQANKLLFFIFFTLLILVSNLKGEANQSFLIKLKDTKSVDKTLGNNNLQTPLLVKLLKLHFQNVNSMLSANQKKTLESLQSYRTIKLSYEDLKKISKDNIALIEPNYTYKIEQDNTKPNDTRYNEQWALHYLDVEKAWTKASGKGILVGIVDTGIDWEHEDLQNQFWINPGEDINGNGKFDPWPSDVEKNGVNGDLNNIDDDKNGTVDDIIGYDFVNQQLPNIGDWENFDPLPIDEYGHGTLVAGVIAAERNNNKGIAGLAYNAKLISLRCFDITGQAYADNIATAIIYGVINGVKVFNLSFGEKYNSSLMQDAINFALESGCTVVASSGNEGSNAPHYPSDYEGVISVGYTNQDGSRNSFNNYGSRIDLLAPGTNILSTSYVGDYSSASGSSLSAPFVSATAAMLLELNPNLSPIDVSGIIDNAADDAGAEGWDTYFGAGILNINNAIDNAYITNLSLSSPINEQTFNKDSIDNIIFKGNIIVPLIKNYEIYIGEGYNPDNWSKLVEEQLQIKNDTIYVLAVNDLKDTSYTFRILVHERNNRTIEKRVRFNIVSEKTKLKITYIKKLPAYFNGKRIILLAVETNLPSVVNVVLKNNQDSSQGFSDLLKKQLYHVIPIDDYIEPGIEYQCTVSASSDVFSTNSANENVSIQIDDDKFSIDKFIKKKYSTELSYIYNKTGNFYHDGQASYVANDLSHGIWSGTDVFHYDKNQMTKRDSTAEISLPVGIGDSNGDGFDEVFTRNVASAILYQAKSPQHSLFSNIIFSDTTSANFFAGTMYDFTGDGQEELVVYSDTAFYILQYIDKQYKIIASAMLDGALKKFGTAPGIACGDFDGDSKQELAFGNDKGNIFIFQFDNNQLNFEYSNTNDYSYSPQYFTKADIDNDDKPEIITANFGTQPLFGAYVSAEPVWSMKVLKSYAPNEYSYIFGEYFYGVKQGSTPSGIFFRNGISSGNIGTGADAVFMSPFPNMYVFTWNTDSRKLQPFWYYPSAFANSVIVYDFDGNGKNEFGFSTGMETEFFEYDNNSNVPNTPTEFDGWSINSDEVYLQWKSVQKFNSPAIAKFFLFAGIEKNGIISIEQTAETNKNNYTFNNLTTDTDYWFGIASISANNESSDTLIKLIHHHTPIQVDKISQINQRRFTFKFTGILSDQVPVPTAIIYRGEKQIESSAISRQDDSSLVAYWELPLHSGSAEFYINSFRDYYNSPTFPSLLQFEIKKDIPQPTELYLKRINIKSFYELTLEYSEPPKPEDAVNLSNYILKPSGKISSISLTNDPAIVDIQFDNSYPIGPLGKEYTITVTNVVAESGKTITNGAGNTLSFTFQANDLKNVFVYPNPIRLSQDATAYFANLTSNAKVYIYNLQGNELNIIQEKNGSGGVEWNGLDSQGNQLPTGIYLFNVKDIDKNGNNIESGLRKFAIVR